MKENQFALAKKQVFRKQIVFNIVFHRGCKLYICTTFFQVLDEDEETVVATMHAGNLFGQILLVYDLPRINSIRCKTNCEIFMLDKHDFRQMLCDYPQGTQFYIYFCMVVYNYCIIWF